MSIELVWETPIQGKKFSDLTKGAPFIQAGEVAPDTVYLKTHSTAAVDICTGTAVDMDPEQGVVPARLRISVWPE